MVSLCLSILIIFIFSTRSGAWPSPSRVLPTWIQAIVSWFVDLTSTVLQVRRALYLADIILVLVGLQNLEAITGRLLWICTGFVGWIITAAAEFISFDAAALLRLHKFLDGLIKVLLKAPEELFVMRSIPFHVPLKVKLCPSLLVGVVAPWIQWPLLSLQASQLTCPVLVECWAIWALVHRSIVPKTSGSRVACLRHWEQRKGRWALFELASILWVAIDHRHFNGWLCIVLELEPLLSILLMVVLFVTLLCDLDPCKGGRSSSAHGLAEQGLRWMHSLWCVFSLGSLCPHLWHDSTKFLSKLLDCSGEILRPRLLLILFYQSWWSPIGAARVINMNLLFLLLLGCCHFLFLLAFICFYFDDFLLRNHFRLSCILKTLKNIWVNDIAVVSLTTIGRRAIQDVVVFPSQLFFRLRTPLVDLCFLLLRFACMLIFDNLDRLLTLFLERCLSVEPECPKIAIVNVRVASLSHRWWLATNLGNPAYFVVWIMLALRQGLF